MTDEAPRIPTKAEAEAIKARLPEIEKEHPGLIAGVNAVVAGLINQATSVDHAGK